MMLSMSAGAPASRVILMSSEVLLDAGAVSRCRRRVHLEHDPAMRETPLAPPNPAAEQRIADAATHRLDIAKRLEDAQSVTSDGWVTVSRDQPTHSAYGRTACVSGGTRNGGGPAIHRHLVPRSPQ